MQSKQLEEDVRRIRFDCEDGDAGAGNGKEGKVHTCDQETQKAIQRVKKESAGRVPPILQLGTSIYDASFEATFPRMSDL